MLKNKCKVLNLNKNWLKLTFKFGFWVSIWTISLIKLVIRFQQKFNSFIRNLVKPKPCEMNVYVTVQNHANQSGSNELDSRTMSSHSLRMHEDDEPALELEAQNEMYGSQLQLSASTDVEIYESIYGPSEYDTLSQESISVSNEGDFDVSTYLFLFLTFSRLELVN